MNPEHLIDLAESLARPTSRGAPRQTDLKRAVSSAYYALLHAVMRRAADEFVGSGSARTQPYVLVYRAIDHGSLRKLCEAILKKPPPPRLQPLVPADGFDPKVEKFAQAVLTLQPKRHDADYNPASRFRASGVLTDIDNARQGIEALRSAPRDQVRSLLAFLVFGVR